MASLANQTISSSYDGLIKTSSDNAVGVSGVQLLQDGSGNDLALSLGRSGQGASISGNLTVDTNTLFVDAANNRVGIGTTSPDYPLVVASSTTATLQIKSGGTTNLGRIFFADDNDLARGFFNYDHNTDNLIIGANNAEAMRIDSSGNVYIGGIRLNPSGNGGDLLFGSPFATYAAIKTDSPAAQDIDLTFHTTTNAGGDGAPEKMRITSEGDVLIGTQGVTDGTTYGGATFRPDSSNRRTLNLGTTSSNQRNLIEFYNGNGLVGNINVNGSSTSYVTSSDYRLKENVVEMTGALDRVDALKPSRFNFIADADKTVDGFLAHEVQAIVPEAVTGEKDAVDEEGNPIYQGIDQSKIVPLLVGAIKELKAEIETLKAQING